MLHNLQESIKRLLEAVAKADGNKIKRRLEKELQPKIADIFNQQGVLFLDGLATTPLAEAEAEAWEVVWWDVSANTYDLFITALQSGMEPAMQAGYAQQVATLGIDLQFQLDSPAAVAYLEKHAAAMVTAIDETTRDALNTIISNGIKNKLSYDQIAEQIQQQFQQFSVKGRGPSHIRSRAELIAVTEIGNAYAEASHQVGLDLAAAGLTVVHSWSNTGDKRVSAGCLANTAQGWIPIDEDFQSGHARPLRFPGCRCAELIDTVD